MKQKLIIKLDLARKKLLDIVNRLPDDRILVDKWAKKDILAHIAGWEEEGIDSVTKILIGQRPDSFRVSINRFNLLSLEKRKNKTVNELQKELADLRSKFLIQINSLSVDQITSFNGTKLGGKPINVLWVINEAISHDTNHTKELEKIIV